MAKRRKRAAAAEPAVTAADKIAGCLAMIATKGMDTEDAAVKLAGIGFTAGEIAGLLSVNENYVRLAKFRKKSSRKKRKAS